MKKMKQTYFRYMTMKIRKLTMHPKKRKILQRDYHDGEYSIYVKQVIDEMFGEEKQGSVKELITVFLSKMEYLK